MYEDLSAEVGVFAFEEFANHLLEQGIDASPSRIHGCLSGLLAAGAPAEREYGLDALGQTLEVYFHGELAGRIMELYAVTAVALEDEEFSFHPLLPDDEDDIDERTRAMAQWCGGFLVGFAQVTAGQTAADALAEDSSEILRDIAAISQADVDGDASEEDLEESYMELVEFLRFAVLNLAMDSLSGAPDNSPGGEQDPALH